MLSCGYSILRIINHSGIYLSRYSSTASIYLLVYFIVVLESVAGVGQLKIPIVDAVFLKSLHQVPCALKRTDPILPAVIDILLSPLLDKPFNLP